MEKLPIIEVKREHSDNLGVTYNREDMEAANIALNNKGYTGEELELFVEGSGRGNWAQEVKATVDKFALKGMLYNQDWVYIICNFVARKISNQLMMVNRKVLRDGTLAFDPAPFHPLNEPLEKPNKHEGYASFIYKIALELCLMGEAIVWKLRFHEQMLLIPTQNVDPCVIDGELSHYVVSGYNSDNAMHTMELHPDDVIHIKLPSQESIFSGLSPFLPLRKAVLFGQFSQEHLLNFYLKQANPSMIYELGTEANEKQAMRFLKSMELRWTGRASNRRTAILPKGVLAKSLSTTFAQQELKDFVKDNRQTLMAVFAIPPHAFGTQETGSIGSEETEKQMRGFWESTGIPYMNLIADGFNVGFRRELGKRYTFKFKTDDIAALQQSDKSKAETANAMLMTHTVNEVRGRIWQDKPIEGGDQPPQSLRAPQIPNFGAFSESQSVTEAEPKEEEKPRITGLGQTPESKKLRTFLKNNPEWTARQKNAEEEQINSLQGRYLKEFLGIYLEAAPEVIEIFKKTFPKIKMIHREKNSNDFKDEMRKNWRQYFGHYEERLAPIVTQSSDTGYTLGLDTPFDLPNKEEIEALGAIDGPGRRTTMAARGLQNFEGVNETTTNRVLDRIQKGVKENKTLDQITRDIRDYFQNVVPNRAATIARTEVLTANSFGQKAAFDDAKKILGDDVKLMWITAGDDRVRSFDKGDLADHTILDGTMQKENGTFDNGLRYPRDPNGEAHEVINCRCTTIMIPPGEDIDTSLSPSDSPFDFFG